MREVAADQRMTATLTNCNLAGCSVNLALTHTERSSSRFFNASSGEWARLKQGEIARLELVVRLGRVELVRR
jgi:hypothetical protein